MAIDEAIADRVTWYYVTADESSGLWDVHLRLRDGQRRTLKVFPEDQPAGDKDEKRLHWLRMIVKRVLGTPTSADLRQAL